MLYLYRRGDGNEGNFPRFLVELGESDCAFNALESLVLSDYNPGAFRDYMAENLETDGESEYGVATMLLEGPEGESAYGAAYITAELEPIADSDSDYMRERHGAPEALADLLDAEALAAYQARRN